MNVRALSAKDIEAAREAIHRGELTFTLTAKDGEPFLLRDLGTLCTSVARLLRTVSKEVVPSERVDWTVAAIGLAGDKLAVTVGGKAPTPRSRRRAAR